jgi:DNA-binding protein HU-beta
LLSESKRREQVASEGLFQGDRDATSQKAVLCRQEDRSSGEGCRENGRPGPEKRCRAAGQGGCTRKKAAEAVLDNFVALVTRQLVKGDKIRLSGLGILQVRDRPARTARNPATGESVAVAASRKIAFRPAKELKNAV